MGRKLDLEILNFDRELGDLRDAVRKLEKASAKCGPALHAYIQALKTLNRSVSGSVDPLLRGLRNIGKAREGFRAQSMRRKCPGTAARQATLVRTPSAPISNGRGRRQRLGAACPDRM